MDPNTLWHFQELFKRVAWIAEQLIRIEKKLDGMDRRISDLQNRPSTQIDKIEYNFEQLKVESLDGTLLIGVTQGVDGKVDEFTLGNTGTYELKIGGKQQQDVQPGGTPQEWMQQSGVQPGGVTQSGVQPGGVTQSWPPQSMPPQDGMPPDGGAQPGSMWRGGMFPLLYGRMQVFFNEDIYKVIEDSAAKHGQEADAALTGAILADLQKQIEPRIMAYMKEHPAKEEADPATEELIYDKVTADIRTALDRFFENRGKGPST